MAKRDYIQEIKSIKSRAEFYSRYDYSQRLNEIEYVLEEFISYNGGYNQELLKYIPISTVACFEAFFRSAVREIVDFGKPFSDNVAKYDQAKIRIDFEIISAIQTKTLTVGELISHLLPFNNYKDIDSNLTTLIGKSYTEELKDFKKISIFENTNKSTENFKVRFLEILKSVNRTYELRHIFCHEFATNIKIDRDEILLNFNNCKTFLDQTNDLIYETLYPNAPETQDEMNKEANKDYEKNNDYLEKLLLFIKEVSQKDSIIGFNENKFNACIDKWKEYRKSHAEYAANMVEGGSMYPTWYTSDMAEVTKEKIRSLENEFEFLLRKNNFSKYSIC